jgi:hypothetical protein
VLSFTLPEEVYRGLELPSFQDLCVFDAGGTPVPFQLRPPQRASQELEVEINIPYFIWQSEKPEAATPGSMDVEIDTRGGIVRVKGQRARVTEPGSFSYLLDLQDFFDSCAAPVAPDGQTFSSADLREQVIRLLPQGNQPLMLSVTMKTSADLDSWVDIGKAQMLVRARQGDMTLQRDTLNLPKTARRYLLLQFAASDVLMSTFSARAVFDKTTQASRETVIDGILTRDKRTVSYLLPGRFPVSALSFDLPQADMMAVRLMGGDDSNNLHNQYGSGFIYRLEKDGATVSGEVFPINYSWRYWDLRAFGDIPFAAAPQMRVHWQPWELLFLARGKAPWTLAFGRSTAVRPSNLPLLGQSDMLAATEVSLLLGPEAATRGSGKLTPNRGGAARDRAGLDPLGSADLTVSFRGDHLAGPLHAQKP